MSKMGRFICLVSLWARRVMAMGMTIGSNRPVPLGSAIPAPIILTTHPNERDSYLPDAAEGGATATLSGDRSFMAAYLR